MEKVEENSNMQACEFGLLAHVYKFPDAFLPSSVPQKVLLGEYVQARRLYHIHEEVIKTCDKFHASVINGCL